MKELVFNKNGQSLTDSLRVAEKFEKRHDSVFRSIKGLFESSPQKCGQCFVLNNYIDDSGKSNPMYIMNRDGFMILAMGFTGAKALEFKFDFIDAFNQMERIIYESGNIRISVVEENIKRRYLLTHELNDVNTKINSLMKRHKEIKKELKNIDSQDFRQLQLFPRYEELELKSNFPANKLKIS